MSNNIISPLTYYIPSRYIAAQHKEIDVKYAALMIIALTSVSQAGADADTNFRVLGITEVTGGYENFVASGQTADGQNIVFAGGNHASGDLGGTFPWASRKNGRLVGMGFNDMQLRLGNRMFVFSQKFEKIPTTKHVPRALQIVRAGNGSIIRLSMDTKAEEVNPDTGNVLDSNIRLAFVVHVKQGDNIVTRREGFKRFDAFSGAVEAMGCKGFPVLPQPDNLIFCSLLTHYAWTLENLGLSAPGLVLTEAALRLDPLKESRVSITSSARRTETIRLASLFGGLEKSSITVVASKHKTLDLHMQYDYVALFPQNPENCGYTGTVAYISGLLNRDQGLLQSVLDKKLVRKYASSAFVIDQNGDHMALKNIERYNAIKSAGDVLRMTEFGAASTAELPGLRHTFDVGSFHRRMITLTDRFDCTYSGMLETQY